MTDKGPTQHLRRNSADSACTDGPPSDRTVQRTPHDSHQNRWGSSAFPTTFTALSYRLPMTVSGSCTAIRGGATSCPTSCQEAAPWRRPLCCQVTCPPQPPPMPINPAVQSPFPTQLGHPNPAHTWISCCRHEGQDSSWSVHRGSRQRLHQEVPPHHAVTHNGEWGTGNGAIGVASRALSPTSGVMGAPSGASRVTSTPLV